MANKAERIMVSNFLKIADRIEKFAERENTENDHYKKLRHDYDRQRRDLIQAFDTEMI